MIFGSVENFIKSELYKPKSKYAFVAVEKLDLKTVRILKLTYEEFGKQTKMDEHFKLIVLYRNNPEWSIQAEIIESVKYVDHVVKCDLSLEEIKAKMGCKIVV